jgi:ech hydrogenase subunit E
MAKVTSIPFGPQHPVLPEPVHLNLILEDEVVVGATPQIGFVHRGLEKLVEKRDYQQFMYVAERICGICSFGHSLGYAQTVEGLLEVEVPQRAQYLRVIWHELSRVHSHLLWLGLLADGFGFEALFMHCWRLRETVLDIFEKTTGGRVIFSACTVGGVLHDIEDSELKGIVETLRGLGDEYQEISRSFLNDRSVNNRLVGIGVLSRQEAYDLSAVGPFARASGVAYDIRSLGYGAYAELSAFAPITSDQGDSYARCKVRVEEVHQSIDIIAELAAKIPAGEIAVPVKGRPVEGAETISRLEQPRGEAFYYVKSNGTKNLARFRVRTPTSINIPGMITALVGCQLADVPMIVLTIDPCISCTER